MIRAGALVDLSAEEMSCRSRMAAMGRDESVTDTTAVASAGGYTRPTPVTGNGPRSTGGIGARPLSD